jgi:hypothetical protein
MCSDSSTCLAEHISKVTKSAVECWLLSSEGINNHKLLHFTKNISNVMKSTVELMLLSNEGINNYKLLQFLPHTDKLLYFLLHTTSFHSQPCIITFSMLKIVRVFVWCNVYTAVYLCQKCNITSINQHQDY